MWEEARLCEEKGKRRRCARRCSGHRRRQEKDEAAILVKCEHPGRAVAADAARRERFDRMAASDSAAAACHLWSAFDSMTWRKDPLDGLKLYSGDEHYCRSGSRRRRCSPRPGFGSSCSASLTAAYVISPVTSPPVSKLTSRAIVATWGAACCTMGRGGSTGAQQRRWST
ncbi:hypothetical protein DAI22_04g285350 [Oryza sativa Japonica Group]|nr:hypothetical protein DAI22_04g285350 [Oryza sativa Japonica Group]